MKYFFTNSMTLHNASPFWAPNHIIVWGTSQTWSAEKKQLSPGRNIISTGSKVLNFWDENTSESLNLWLALKDGNTIKQAISHILDYFGDILVFWMPVELTLHAMSQNGISKNYPQEIVQALEKYGVEVRSILFISYEAGYNPTENPAGSHVYYPVRDTKNALEQSVLQAGKNGKIIDLLTFDSKSAKALGFTFLGVVGDFVSFLESDFPGEMKEYLKHYLWNSYTAIQALFQKLPIRWPLAEGQESMKELAQKWALNPHINLAAKDMNFALFSRISGEITNLYLQAAMKYMNQERDEILKNPQARILLDWKTISLVDGFDNMLQNCLEALQKREASAQALINSNTETDIFLEHAWAYTLNPLHISTLWEHFGIVPLILTENLILGSWLLEKDEYIKSSRPQSMIFAWNDIALKREINLKNNKEEIIAYNPQNPGEIFGVFEIASKTEMHLPSFDTQKSFFVPFEEKEINPAAFPHALSWGKTHLNRPQTSIHSAPVAIRASIKEHIGFRLAHMILNTPNRKILAALTQRFPKFQKFIDQEGSVISGKFARIETDFETEEMSEEVTPEVYISDISYWKFGINVEVFLFQKGILKGKYRFIIQ